jgi:recombination protein RecR
VLEHVPSVEKLLKLLQQIPSLSSKNLYRIADHFLSSDQLHIEQFCNSLQFLCNSVSRCAICFVWKQKASGCLFCTNDKRNKSLICVVEQWQDLLIIEKTKGYEGLYHVLGGAINPLEGIHPDDLTLKSLLKRLELFSGEVIIATNQTPAGEATAAYIARASKEFSCKISCLARGLPIGSYLEGMDSVTIFKALIDRRPL